MKITALTLDLDDTLWPVWPAIARAEAALKAWLSVHAPRTATAYTPESNRAIRESLFAQVSAAERADVGAMRRRSIAVALERAGDDPALAAAAYEAFDTGRQEVEFYPDSRAALERLAARYPIVAITNGSAAVERIGIGAHFKAAVSPRAHGLAKPDPRVFHLACEMLGAPPGAVLHVGDDPALDVIGARNAGLAAAWINRGALPWPEPSSAGGHHEFPDLSTLADWLLDAER